MPASLMKNKFEKTLLLSW